MREREFDFLEFTFSVPPSQESRKPVASAFVLSFFFFNSFPQLETNNWDFYIRFEFEVFKHKIKHRFVDVLFFFRHVSFLLISISCKLNAKVLTLDMVEHDMRLY